MIILMPVRNIIRREVDDGHYHVYARGASKDLVFIDGTDKQKFIGLFERYLSPEVKTDSTGYVYSNFHGRVRLEAYCLMDNHFHLLLHQASQGDIASFMRCVMTSYSRYFNLRHKKSGSLFETRYKSSLIDDDAYFAHISRYIHLNRRSWKYYKYSSIGFYRSGNNPNWFDNSHILSGFGSREEYLMFLKDYEDNQIMMNEIKHDLANY